MNNIVNGYTAYTTPAAIQVSAVDSNQLGFVGTSVTVTVSYSWSVTVSYSWSF